MVIKVLLSKPWIYLPAALYRVTRKFLFVQGVLDAEKSYFDGHPDSKPS